MLPQEGTRVTVFSTRRACPSCGQSFAELDPRLFSFNSRHGWCESCYGTGVEMPGFDEQQSGEELWWNEWYAHTPEPCGNCQGQRLNPTALSVRFRGRSIAALAAAAAAAAEDKAARAVLLRGAGGHFCAGGDIGMFADLIRMPAEERRKVVYQTVDALHPLLTRLRHMPKPVVAAVQGAAAGFGLSLVLAADLARFAGYYRWDIYYRTIAGDVLLPIGYAATSPIPVTEYLATHPQ